MFIVDAQGVAKRACHERKARPRFRVNRSAPWASEAALWHEKGENALVAGDEEEADRCFREAHKLARPSKVATAKERAQTKTEQDRKLAEEVFV